MADHHVGVETCNKAFFYIGANAHTLKGSINGFACNYFIKYIILLLVWWIIGNSVSGLLLLRKSMMTSM
jgi:hypothetical protein